MKILIVEDNLMFAELLSEHLKQRMGHEVVGIVSNREAMLDILKLHQCDIALVDIHLPPDQLKPAKDGDGKNKKIDDGIDFAKEAKCLYPDLKILFISSHRSKKWIREAREFANGYHVKEDSLYLLPQIYL